MIRGVEREKGREELNGLINSGAYCKARTALPRQGKDFLLGRIVKREEARDERLLPENLDFSEGWAVDAVRLRATTKKITIPVFCQELF